MGEINTDKINPVVESDGDKAHRVARALISSLPVLGGPAVEVFGSLIEPPLEKRKLEWMLEITKVVNDLQEKFSLDIETLAKDDQFISILLNSSQIALKNHQKEKLSALRIALINTARNSDLTEDQQFTFLSLIDEFTPTHLKILIHTHLGFAWSPASGKGSNNTWLEFSRILLRDIPEFRNQGDFIYQIVSDLQSKKLIHVFRIQHLQELKDGNVSIQGVSEWGQFLSFQPENIRHLDAQSTHKYVSLPTELGISFLNYIYCDE